MIDLSALAKSRILWQYRNGASYRQWIDTLPAISQEGIATPADTLYNILDIDAQEGAQLDLLGRIVGVRRQAIVVNDETATFSLDGGQLGDDEGQLTAKSYNSTSPFGDAAFRLLIRARISRNTNDATIDGIIRALSFVVDQNDIRVQDNLNMTFTVYFGEELTGVQRFVLDNYDIIPRPQGVRLLGYLEAPLVTQLGEDGAQLGGFRDQLNATN